MEQMKISMVDDIHKGPDREYDDIVRSFSSSSSSSSVSGISSGSSLESDSFEEVTSPTSSSSSNDQLVADDPLSDMSSLFQQLPIKRGLSKYYQGKSQSFTSLKNVRSLEDLAKPENPYNKRLKSCKSYGGGFAESYKTKCNIHGSMSRGVSKRGIIHSPNSRGSWSSLTARRGSGNFMGSRPPIPPHRSSSTTTTIPNQTVLFA